MNQKTRLPYRIEYIELEADKYYPLDSKGFECVAKAESSAVLVSLHDKAPRSEQFWLKSGDSFEFTGKIYVKSNSTSSTTTSKINVLYYKTV